MFWHLFTGTMRAGHERERVRCISVKIVADENMPGLAPLEAIAELVRLPGRSMTAAQLRDADVLLVRSVTRVDEALLADTPVRFVGSATIGTDHVDQQALAAAGVRFAHAPGCNAMAVAEYVLQAALHWAQQGGRRLADCRVAVVGVGNVGTRVTALAGALGCHVLPCDPPRARAGEHLVWPWVDIAEVLRADVITLHVPLVNAGDDVTRHLFSEAALSALRADQLLVNTCRGAVIDNRALQRRLASPDAPAVVLDVWEQEPQVPASLFSQVLLGTPHIAGYSVEGKLRGTAQVVAALFDWLGNTGVPQPVVPPGLAWPGAVKDEAGLLDLLRSRYDLRQDHARLAAVLGGSEPATGFDQLRRDYPARHEMAGVSVSGAVAPAFEAVLSLLGVEY